MANERQRVQGVVIAEDRRTERFFRHLLVTLGFDKRKVRFSTAPRGKGAAEAWVRKQYVPEVKELRRKHVRRFLMVVRDGDRAGVAQRKQELDLSLEAEGLPRRAADEPIATPVPTWAIENWLLGLLGQADVDEQQGPSSDRTWKQVFESEHAREETKALKDAAVAWSQSANMSNGLPSMADGREELERLDH